MIKYVSNQLYSWDEVGLESDAEDIAIPSSLSDNDNTYNIYYYYVNDTIYYIGESIN